VAVGSDGDGTRAGDRDVLSLQGDRAVLLHGRVHCGLPPGGGQLGPNRLDVFMVGETLAWQALTTSGIAAGRGESGNLIHNMAAVHARRFEHGHVRVECARTSAYAYAAPQLFPAVLGLPRADSTRSPLDVSERKDVMSNPGRPLRVLCFTALVLFAL